MCADWTTDSLPKVCDLIWNQLIRVPIESANPWRTPGLATVAAGGPQVRTVVLRAVSAADRQLVAFSDARAPKIAQLRSDGRAQWLFFDPVRLIQVRAQTVVEIHQDNDVTRTFWNTVPETNRHNYRTVQPPGAVVTRLEEAREQFGESEAAQFAVLSATVIELDWVWLADGGHRRARFRWVEESWAGEWLVP